MPNTRPDRRPLRTRQVLKEALIQLVLERGYESITVQDILDRANVGRSAFYAHFRDKEDLLLSGFEEIAEGIRQHFPANAPAEQLEQNTHSLTLSIFTHAQSHRPLFKAMFGKQGGEVVVRQLRKLLIDLAGEQIRAITHQGQGVRLTVPEEALVQWVVSSFLALLTWWLDQDIPLTAEEVDAVLWKLARPGIQAVSGGSPPPPRP
jgi:AcrR family transcriptional regulator